MERRENADEATERQVHAYRRRLQEILAATASEDGTSLVRELQDLALEVSAGAPPLQQGNCVASVTHELMGEIYRALKTKSTWGVR